MEKRNHKRLRSLSSPIFQSLSKRTTRAPIIQDKSSIICVTKLIKITGSPNLHSTKRSLSLSLSLSLCLCLSVSRGMAVPGWTKRNANTAQRKSAKIDERSTEERREPSVNRFRNSVCLGPRRLLPRICANVKAIGDPFREYSAGERLKYRVWFAIRAG